MNKQSRTYKKSKQQTGPPPMTAWRYFGADLVGGKPVLRSPLATIDFLETPRSPRSTCGYGHKHAAPSKVCDCGWNLTCDLPDLVEYVRRLHFEAETRAVLRSGGDFAFARCETIGARILGDADRTGVTVNPSTGRPRWDGRGIVRAAQFRIVGPILLPASLSDPATVRKFAAAFKCQVEATDLPTLEWLEHLAGWASQQASA